MNEHTKKLLLERKKSVQEAIDNYESHTGLHGYTILRAARDGLIQVKQGEEDE